MSLLHSRLRCLSFAAGLLAATDTTIRTESAHLMAVDVRTAAGELATRTFYANVRRPQLQPAPPQNAAGGSSVHMFLAGEAEDRRPKDSLNLNVQNRFIPDSPA